MPITKENWRVVELPRGIYVPNETRLVFHPWFYDSTIGAPRFHYVEDVENVCHCHVYLEATTAEPKNFMWVLKSIRLN